MIKVKCLFGEERRIVSISPRLTLNEVRHELEEIFQHKLVLSFHDQQGDPITIETQYEWDQAMSQSFSPVPSLTGNGLGASANSGGSGSSTGLKLYLTPSGANGYPLSSLSSSSFSATVTSSSSQHHHQLLGTGLGSNTFGPNSSVYTDQAHGPHDTFSDTIEYQKGDVIGSGAFGTVFRAINIRDGSLMAVKEIVLDPVFGSHIAKEIETVKEEIRVFSNMRHQHLIRYIGTDVNHPTVSIFMEYAAIGSISSLLGRFGQFPEMVIRRYTRQILLGLKFLHDHRIVHRDIKGANILVTEPGTVKLADFGASATLKTVTSATQKLKTVRGTPYWMAPEIIKEAGYGRKSDIWSVACTIIEMATTKPPFSHMEPMPALFHIGTTEALPALPADLPSAHSLLVACLNRNPEQRPSADQILDRFEFVRLSDDFDESSDEEDEGDFAAGENGNRGGRDHRDFEQEEDEIEF